MNGSTVLETKKPSAAQLPAEGHDTEPASELWPPPTPGITCAGLQVPPFSSATNATGRPGAPKYPTALQLPAEGHDTDRASAFTFVALVSKARPWALPQVPPFSSATNGSRFPLASV